MEVGIHGAAVDLVGLGDQKINQNRHRGGRDEEFDDIHEPGENGFHNCEFNYRDYKRFSQW